VVVKAPVRVFIAYARENERELREFRAFVRPYEKDGVTFFDDRHIPPGTRWRDTILEQLDAADIVVVLLTQKFVDSAFCMDVEADRALRRSTAGECELFLVNVDHFVLEDGSPIAKLQHYPSGRPILHGELPETAEWARIAKQLNRQLRRLRAVAELRPDVFENAAGDGDQLTSNRSRSAAPSAGLAPVPDAAAPPAAGADRRTWWRSPAETRFLRRIRRRRGAALLAASVLALAVGGAGGHLAGGGSEKGSESLERGAGGAFLATDYLRLDSVLENSPISLETQTIRIAGTLARPLPSGMQIWVATRRVHGDDSPTLSGAPTGVDGRGPCEVRSDRWDCGNVNLGDARETGDYAVYVLLADSTASRALVGILREQLIDGNYRHQLPGDLASLPRVLVTRPHLQDVAHPSIGAIDTAGDYSEVFGDKKCSTPPRPRSSGEHVAITEPTNGARAGTPGADGALAHETIKGTADLAPGEKLWLFFYATDPCLYYDLGPADVGAGIWEHRITMAAKEKGPFILYAVIVDEEEGGQIEAALRVARGKGDPAPAFYRLPPRARASYITLVCCK
jgi:hypothetical protein